LTSTGQPERVAPVSTFKEKIKCLIVTPLIIASKNNDRNPRSTTGVPVMPSGLMLPQGRPEVTGAPTERCQITLPVLALSAYTRFVSVAPMIIAPPPAH